ncbi:MAG TPA: hypothetical protein VNQ79_06740 [Blastocatellia bacterium]|nr:hypothetical protein [Blastocatellia bacterium]
MKQSSEKINRDFVRGAFVMREMDARAARTHSASPFRVIEDGGALFIERNGRRLPAFEFRPDERAKAEETALRLFRLYYKEDSNGRVNHW